LKIRNAQNAITGSSLWHSTPRSSMVVFFLAVFFVFTSFGFVGDVLDLGRQSPVRFAISVFLTGLFAVGYAIGGIAMRGKSWMVLIPWFAIQFVAMGLVASWFPNLPAPLPSSAEGLARLHSRMAFDGTGITLGVSLGYAGFIVVFIREGRRYLKTRLEVALFEGEMVAAREIQEVILPGASESFPGFRVESVYRPAQQVGGDFFQIVSVGGNGLLVVLGDVAGKGLPAAMLVSMLVGSIRVIVDETHDPAAILQKLHSRLVGRTRGGFCTALAAYIAADGLVTIANAGHLSPYLDGREIELPGALPLGIASDAQYESTAFSLPPGGRLTFYSDGVPEATDPGGNLFGFDRALAISSQSASAIAEAAVNFGQSDDITVVTVERLVA